MIELTYSDLQNIITESIKTVLISESQESASIKEATRLVMDRLGYSKEQADRFIRIDLRASFPILRSKQGGKFILGVTRMYLDRQIYDASMISSLNQTLKYIVTPAHYNEYDRNLNGLSAQQLIDRFKQARTDDLEKDKAELDKTQYTEHPEYKIVRIDSFEQAAQYGRYNDWCLAQDDGEYNFDQYTSNGVNQLYFILRDGFEKEPRVKGKNAPYDSYGLSMMTVIVDPEGMMTQSTTRWNHENDSSDSAFTPKQISEIIGRNFYEVFKPNTKFKDAVADALKRLRNGEPIDEIFDTVRLIGNGLYAVELLNKYNILTSQKAFISQKWLDYIGEFKEGLAAVNLNEKWSFINTQGELIGNGNLWFDYVEGFTEGFAIVRVNRKSSFINTNGELIGNGNLWFDAVNDFNEGFARVRLNWKWSFINTKGELIGDGNLWFDNSWSFKEGFAKVKLNGKYSFINTKGELIGDGNLWFDEVEVFDGLLIVRLNGKWSFINSKGELIGNGKFWFDNIWGFSEGFARVELNEKYSFINTKGELIGNGNLWFDEAENFQYGFALIKSNGKYSFINTKGELIGNGNLWFDSIWSFSEGFAMVKLNGKYSFINTKGELIGNGKLWFNGASFFEDGFARIKSNGKYSFINTKGELIANGNLWFDEAWAYTDGFMWVKLNEEFYFIKILSNNEVQFYDSDTKKPIPSPLTNQNESKKIIKLKACQLQEIIKQCLTEIID